MRTITLKAMIDKIARGDGVVPGSGSYDDDYVGMIVDFLNDRVKTAIRFDFWPEWCRVEQRAFRPIWQTGVFYVAGDEVYRSTTGDYYRCVLATDGVSIAPEDDDGTYWEAPGDDFEQYIPYETSHGTLRKVWRPEWDVDETYATDEEVWVTSASAYYVAVQESTGVNPADDDGTYWEEVGDDFQNEIPMEARLLPIGEVKSVSLRHPEYSQYPYMCPFEPVELGISVDSAVGNYPYVKYRRRPPRYSSVEWDAGTAYAAGDLVYYQKNAYMATAANTGETPSALAFWELQPVLEIFETYLKVAVCADLLREDGQGDKASIEEARAADLLEDARDEQIGAQSYFSMARVIANW
jgi:hypothetical protein